MGDFDRIENPGKKDESKKLIMVAALGVLLLGLVWFQFMKKSPEAMASPVTVPAGGSASADPASGQTPDQVMAQLQQDPTAGLLMKESAIDTPAKPPRNPFQMSATWRASLVKPVKPAPIVKNNTPTPTPRPQPAAAPLSLSSDNFKLSGIIHQGSTLYAIINNHIVSVGNVVGKARVVDIHENGVTLQHVDSPDGPLLELSSQSSSDN